MSVDALRPDGWPAPVPTEAGELPLPIRPTVPAASSYPAALGLGLAAVMALTIAATLTGGLVGALTSLVLLAGAVIVFAVQGRDLWALGAFFTYAALEGMYKYLTSFSQAVYVVKPLLIVVLVGGWLLHRRRQTGRAPGPPLVVATALFIVWSFLMAFHPAGGGIAGGLATALLWYGGPAVFYYLGYHAAQRSLASVERILYVLVAVSTVVSAFALVQYLMGQPWTEAHLPGYATMSQTSASWFVADEVKGGFVAGWRPASTTSMPGGGAFYAYLGVLLTFGLILRPSMAPGTRVTLIVCLLLNFVALLVTGVRLYVVILMFAAPLLLVLSARTSRVLGRNAGFALLAAMICLGGFLTAQMLSGGALIHRYAETLANPMARYQKDRGGNLTYLPAFLSANPFGMGYQRGVEGYSQQGFARKFGSDSTLRSLNRETQFNSVAIDMGLPGLALLVGLLVAILVQGWRSLRRLSDPSLRVLGATLFVLLCGYAAACLGGPALQGADPFWTGAALLFSLPLLQHRQRRSATPGLPPQAQRL